MFKILVNAWKVNDIRKKLIFIALLLIIYRLGSHIPLPGVDMALLYGGSLDTLNTDNIFAMIAGGGYATVFAMGIGPYITASIIMQLLTYAIPKLEQIQKEGEEGRKKINQITRYVAVGMSLINAAALTYSYANTSVGSIFRHDNILTYSMATISMVAGTIFIMWLAELLTEKGIGNGSSFIIFANILASLPSAVNSLRMLVVGGDAVRGWVTVIAVLVVFTAVIAFVVLVQEGERRIPVQYSKKMTGRSFGNQNSFIPIKVNIAGVMSIIFAITLLQFPQQIANFWPNETLGRIVSYLDTSHWVGAILYIALIFMFTFFYTSFAINTTEMAENMKKNGGFIPGIRPGKPTSEYVQRTVDRLSLIGAILYSIIAITPVLFQIFTGMNSMFGGTTLLIVTGVALEFIKQLESQLLMRHYKGFLN